MRSGSARGLMRIPANDDVDSLLSGVCHRSFLEDQPMDLGVLGLEQCCRECSIRLLITGVEQRIEQRPREIVHISVARPCGKRRKKTISSSNAA
jgi:hypothetical protein